MSDPVRSEQIRDQIERVAAQIDDELLSLASPEARQEWASARTLWRGSTSKLVAEDLAVVLTKVRRFGDILRDMKGRASLDA
jgi:hypothetical protein